MDIYNHRAAIELFGEYKVAGIKTEDKVDVFMQGVQDRRFVLYPFPMVSKNSL